MIESGHVCARGYGHSCCCADLDLADRPSSIAAFRNADLPTRRPQSRTDQQPHDAVAVLTGSSKSEVSQKSRRLSLIRLKLYFRQRRSSPIHSKGFICQSVGEPAINQQPTNDQTTKPVVVTNHQVATLNSQQQRQNGPTRSDRQTNFFCNQGGHQGRLYEHAGTTTTTPTNVDKRRQTPTNERWMTDDVDCRPTTVDRRLSTDD
mgnify:FL=1